MFQVGDPVFVPGSGVSIISRLEESYGSTLYVVQDRAGAVYKVPLGKVRESGWRRPVSRSKMQQALQELTKNQKGLAGRNPFAKDGGIKRRLFTSNPAELAGLVRDLYTKEGKEASSTKLEHFERALLILASEVAYVFGLPLMGTRGLIEAAIANRQLPPALKTP